jgi:Transcription factor WhiB.
MKVDPNQFVPDMSVKGALTKANQAKLLCVGCPYLEECLAYAMETHQEGVWGGTTTHERTKMRRQAVREKYAGR